MKEPRDEDIQRRYVKPEQLRNGKLVLRETIVLKEIGHDSRGLTFNKRIVRVWPPCKQANGRGKMFDLYEDAIQAIVDWEAETGQVAHRRMRA